MTTPQPIRKQEDDDPRVYKLPDGRLAKKFGQLANGDLIMQVIPDEPAVEKSTPEPESKPPTHEPAPVYKSAQEQLDELVAKHAREHGCDRPTATVAVCKTAEGRRLYAESIRKTAAPQASEPSERLAKARMYESELAALAKRRGLRLADAAKTPEGRELYNAAIRASRMGGV